MNTTDERWARRYPADIVLQECQTNKSMQFRDFKKDEKCSAVGIVCSSHISASSHGKSHNIMVVQHCPEYFRSWYITPLTFFLLKSNILWHPVFFENSVNGSFHWSHFLSCSLSSQTELYTSYFIHDHCIPTEHDEVYGERTQTKYVWALAQWKDKR